jgi:hypothetical protein
VLTKDLEERERGVHKEDDFLSKDGEIEKDGDGYESKDDEVERQTENTYDDSLDVNTAGIE